MGEMMLEAVETSKFKLQAPVKLQSPSSRGIVGRGWLVGKPHLGFEGGAREAVPVFRGGPTTGWKAMGRQLYVVDDVCFHRRRCTGIGWN